MRGGSLKFPDGKEIRIYDIFNAYSVSNTNVNKPLTPEILFIEHSVNYDKDYGTLIKKYLDFSSSLWIDSILTPLDFKTIENRIWCKLNKIPSTDNTVSLSSPVYSFRSGSAINDYVIYDDFSGTITVGGNNVNLKENKIPKLIDGNPWKNIDNILLQIVYSPQPGRSDQTQISGAQLPQNMAHYVNIQQYLTTIKKINDTYYHDENKNLFFIISEDGDDKQVRFFHLIKEGNIYKFHPHNLINFLPNITDENLFKSLFKDITSNLNTFIKDSYNNKPDGFFHIHVTKIDNEENTALLTLHARYEIITEGNDIEYIYNGKPRTRKGIRGFNDTSKREHSSYLLLNLKSHNHSLFTIHPNAPISQSWDMFKQQESCHSGFALTENINGATIFDINYIENKGIILTKARKPCTRLCDSTYVAGHILKKIQNKQNYTNLRTAAENQALLFQHKIRQQIRQKKKTYTNLRKAAENQALLFEYKSRQGGKRKYTQKRNNKRINRKSRRSFQRK